MIMVDGCKGGINDSLKKKKKHTRELEFSHLVNDPERGSDIRLIRIRSSRPPAPTLLCRDGCPGPRARNIDGGQVLV